MKIPEKLKQYLKESPQTWDDIHILDYDCNGISESRYLSGNDYKAIEEYASSDSDRHQRMVDKIRERLDLTTLQYQRLEDLIEAIGLPKEKLCTYCWDGAE